MSLALPRVATKCHVLTCGFALLLISACATRDPDELDPETQALVSRIGAHNYDDMDELFRGMKDSSRDRLRIARDLKNQAPAEASSNPDSQSRAPASVSSGGAKRSYFKTTAKACSAFTEASANSPVLVEVKAGKKIWLEEIDSTWLKVQLKNSPAFVQKNCF